MSKLNKVGKLATTIKEEGKFIAVTYHWTNVVRFNSKKIVLDTGGWFTVTTKTRMNQASNQFNLGYYVYQKDSKWYVDFKSRKIEFKNNELVLNR